MSLPNIFGIITQVIQIIEGFLSKAEKSPDGKISAAELRSGLTEVRALADEARAHHEGTHKG